MVQVHAARHVFERPDATRIAALSGAMALNFAGLLMLLIPISMPTAPPRVEEPTPELIFPEVVVIKPVPPIPDAPRLPERTRPVARPLPQPTPDTRPTFTETARPEISVPSVPLDVTPTEPGFVEGPAEVGDLATILATPPPYPIKALRRGIEGTVHLRILVDVDGLPLEVEIGRSSGNRELDNEARRHVLKKWRFQPALRDGAPVQAWGSVDIAFSLGRG